MFSSLKVLNSIKIHKAISYAKVINANKHFCPTHLVNLPKCNNNNKKKLKTNFIKVIIYT